MGLVCLLSLGVARSVQADEPPTKGAEASVKEPDIQRVPGSLTTAPPTQDRLILPPFVRDRRGGVTTKALFPIYFGRTSPSLSEHLVPPYYYLRSPSLDVDVAAGLIWSLRGPDRNTFILPPLFYTHRKGESWTLGLFPLFSTGVLQGHHHTIIPPLLTWIDGDDEKQRMLLGPYFDFRTKATHRTFRGLFPLVWAKSDDTDRFAVVPPLFFRFADDDPLDYTTVVPPFFHTRDKERTAWGLVPLLFHKETEELKTTTIPLSLFQFARGSAGFRLITPIFAHLRDADNERLTITPLYQRRRGDRNLDGVGPFFFRTWDDRDMSRGLFLAPIYWNWQDPANDITVVFPFFGRRYRAGIRHTWFSPLIAHSENYESKESSWWVLPPVFQYGETTDGFQFNAHPLLYVKRTTEHDHTVLAPLWFDFEDRKNQTRRRLSMFLYWHFENDRKAKEQRIAFPWYWDFSKRKLGTRRIVGFPFYWDFRNEKAETRVLTVLPPLYARATTPERTRTVVLNTFHEKVRDGKRESFQFHFAPLFSLGRSERGRWWKVFYGLFGYEERGNHRRAQVLFMNVDLDD